MSQSRREARREARRAESPPDPRNPRRRRLNSPGDQPREIVSSWLEQQQGLTRPIAQAQTNSSPPLPGIQTLLRSINHLPDTNLNPEPDHNHFDMQDLLMGNQGPGPSPAHHPRPIDGRSHSIHSQHNGPLLTLDQIVSEDQSTPGSELPAVQAAFDSDGSQSDSTDSAQGSGSLFGHGNFSGAYRVPDVPSIPSSGVSDLVTGSCHSRGTAVPINPTILLAYHLDRNTSCSQPSVRFLPFIPVSQRRNSSHKNKRYMIQPSHKQRIDASPTREARWVPGKVPVEIFEAITQYLSRDDIKSMRLVCKEMEIGVSHSLFDTVVVPFNTELYEMIEQKAGAREESGSGSLLWKNALNDTDDKVYRGHGLKVFEGFGGHIRRFGMSFEIKEEALQNPPQKNQLDQHESYFGAYAWPSQEYTRFEQLAGLERTADETSQMKLAFSHLSRVQQLALSMDSGLGWMNGPDRSLRSLILQRLSPLFGCSHGVVDADQQDRIRLWETIESAHARLGALEDLKEGQLERVNMDGNFFHRVSFSTTPYASPASWATAPLSALSTATAGAIDDNADPRGTGVLYISTPDSRDNSPNPVDVQKIDMIRRIEKFSPASLNKHQKEWLLEAEWAQRAFLITYMLGVVDNSSVFNKVSVLTFRISSHLVPLLSRHDFWISLPKLQEVSLAVIPDWRTVERDEAGIVETKDINPSCAVDKTFNLLQDFIGVRPKITKLSFTWVSGGEHAEGMFARNHHILPAPVTTVARSTAILQQDKDDHLINLPHIKDLTWSNCWFTPISIVAMVKKLRKASLKKLKFDSVSLTAMPRANAPANAAANGFIFPNQNGGFQAGPAAAAHVTQATHAANAAHAAHAAAMGTAMMGGTFAAQFGARVWQGPPHGVPVQQWAQTMLQNLNFMTQQQGMVLQQVPQVWTNHPMGMTMQQITAILNSLAAGNGQGVHPMAQPGMLYQHQHQQQGDPDQIFFAPLGPTNPLFPPLVPSGHLPPPPPTMPAGPPPPLNIPTGPPPPPAAAAGWFAPPPMAPHAPPAPAPTNGPWYEGHRSGSWVKVIDTISPGPRLEMYKPRDEFEPAPERRKKGLVSVEFKSCGYVQLRSASFDQNNVEAPTSYRMSGYFSRRQSLLTPAMLTTTDKLVGCIIQYMSEHESEALHHAWGMRMGWDDTKLAEEAEYDGYLAGGSGRFSGSVDKDSTIQQAYAAERS